MSLNTLLQFPKSGYVIKIAINASNHAISAAVF